MQYKINGRKKQAKRNKHGQSTKGEVACVLCAIYFLFFTAPAADLHCYYLLYKMRGTFINPP